MPTVMRLDGYRFFFYSGEGNEPPHIHVEHGDRVAKYWLEPVELASSARFRSHELGEVQAIVDANRDSLVRAWHEHFDA